MARFGCLEQIRGSARLEKSLKTEFNYQVSTTKPQNAFFEYFQGWKPVTGFDNCYTKKIPNIRYYQ